MMRTRTVKNDAQNTADMGATYVIIDIFIRIFMGFLMKETNQPCLNSIVEMASRLKHVSLIFMS